MGRGEAFFSLVGYIRKSCLLQKAMLAVTEKSSRGESMHTVKGRAKRTGEKGS